MLFTDRRTIRSNPNPIVPRTPISTTKLGFAFGRTASSQNFSTCNPPKLYFCMYCAFASNFARYYGVIVLWFGTVTLTLLVMRATAMLAVNVGTANPEKCCGCGCWTSQELKVHLTVFFDSPQTKETLLLLL